MRLLHYNSTGELELTQYSDNEVPPYAILSHMWGPDEEEVTYDGLVNGTGKERSGYQKIRFSGDQAKKDGLDYFWVDTCCINKENRAELSNAIQSMFLWYQRAARCYVYLSDVSAADTEEKAWKSVFRKSRWFTRGWTLQELLAPISTVDFFSKDGVRLGNRMSLAHEIHEVTGIPHSALKGGLLSQFSIKERLRWSECRQTTIPEDKAYALLGILCIADLAPCYGEGVEGAFRRLHAECQKLEKCLKDIRITDPSDDKKRIEDTKGGLLKDSYRWILDNTSFRQWRYNSDSQANLVSPLLWIKGDPGKGKTMLLCGIIDELQTSIAKTSLLAYFFCQATDTRIDNAVAVLRGLLYMLIKQQPSLASHVRKRYDEAGKSLFEDANAWFALTEILADVLEDPSLDAAWLVIDALDECVTELPKLLDFVAKRTQSSGVAHIKWIISSRNWPDIEERLKQAGHIMNLSLELNSTSISAAVGVFIEQKLSKLAREKNYDDKMRAVVLHHLTSHANDTFLWVSLVCQNLESTSKRNVLKKLQSFPPGLDSLYERMLQQINQSDDADLCKQILAFTTLVHRPITLEELLSLVEELHDLADDLEAILEIIKFCGSFLTMRDSTIYFVHQSAKDFILSEATDEVFPSGTSKVHLSIATRSLQIMSETLRRNLYSLKPYGGYVAGEEPPNPDPLATARYSCIYWVDHLSATIHSGNNSSAVQTFLRNEGLVHIFIKEKFLYWLEALSLSGNVSKGVVSVSKLYSLVMNTSLDSSLIYDAYRFIMSHKSAIESSPHQVYSSALIFSPSRSILRNVFFHEKPEWLICKLIMSDDWGACLKTLEGHDDHICSVAISHDSTLIASSSYACEIKTWDVSSGACLQTLQGHTDCVSSVAFSHDSTWLVSGSEDADVRIWNVKNGACLQTLKEHTERVFAVTFSHDSSLVASGSAETAKIWLASSGECMYTLRHDEAGAWINSISFSHDSTQLATGTQWGKIYIWSTSKGLCLRTLESLGHPVKSVAFSPKSNILASGTAISCVVKIWDVDSGQCLRTIAAHRDAVNSVAFSYDSKLLASASHDTTIKIWDIASGACVQILKGHESLVSSVAFSQDLTQEIIVSGSGDMTVKVWDRRRQVYNESAGDGKFNGITDIVFSHDSTRLASRSIDGIVMIRDTSSMECLLTLKHNGVYVFSIAFSHDSLQLATGTMKGSLKIWDTNSGVCLQTFEGHEGPVNVAFSHDSTQIATASREEGVKIWRTSDGQCLQTIETRSDRDTSDYTVVTVTFSHDSTWLAVGFSQEDPGAGIVKIWDVSKEQWVHTFKDAENVTVVAFSRDSRWLAAASTGLKIRIWDIDSGACLKMIDFKAFEWLTHRLSFTSDGYLDTNIGLIALDMSSGSGVSTPGQSRPAQLNGLHLSGDRMWIMYGNKKLLWLPQEYRTRCRAVRDNTLALGSNDGTVWTFAIDPEKDLAE